VCTEQDALDPDHELSGAIEVEAILNPPEVLFLQSLQQGTTEPADTFVEIQPGVRFHPVSLFGPGQKLRSQGHDARIQGTCTHRAEDLLLKPTQLRPQSGRDILGKPILDGHRNDEDRARPVLSLEFTGGLEGEAGHARLQGHYHVIQQVDLPFRKHQKVVGSIDEDGLGKLPGFQVDAPPVDREDAQVL
jgi:hypothetical protein